MDKWVDFNQGLGAKTITDEAASYLSKLKLRSGSGIKIRLAYNGSGSKSFLREAIERLQAVGIRKRDIMVYLLYNFKDGLEGFLERLRDVLNWGAVAYPMRYQPLNALVKGWFVSQNWTEEELEQLQDARRVLGYGGAFPPYQGLIGKINKARNFDEAFSLRPARKKK